MKQQEDLQSLDTDASNRGKRVYKSTLIEPFRQIRFGIYVIGLSILFVVTTSAVVGFAFYQQYQQLMEIFAITDPAAQYQLVTNDIFYKNAIRIGIVFIVFIGLMFALVFRLTHRYYGPLVSIERFIDEFSVGQYQKRVKIRKGDELQRLVDKLNIMAAELEKKLVAGAK